MRIAFIFQNFEILCFYFFKKPTVLWTFSKKCFEFLSKKQQFEELFQKRCATGICDLRGSGPCIVRHPIYPPYLRGFGIHKGGYKSCIGCQAKHVVHPLKSQIPVVKRFWKSSSNSQFFEEKKNLQVWNFEEKIISQNMF